MKNIIKTTHDVTCAADQSGINGRWFAFFFFCSGHMSSPFPQDDRWLSKILAKDNALQDGSQSAVTSLSLFIFSPILPRIYFCPIRVSNRAIRSGKWGRCCYILLTGIWFKDILGSILSEAASRNCCLCFHDHCSNHEINKPLGDALGQSTFCLPCYSRMLKHCRGVTKVHQTVIYYSILCHVTNKHACG